MLKPKGLNIQDHPQALTPEQRKRWHELCNELLTLYKLCLPGKTRRVIIGGCDANDATSSLLLFRANPIECARVIGFIKEL